MARVITILAFAGGASRAFGQRFAQDVEPKWFRAHFTGASVGAYVEGTAEDANYSSGVSSHYHRLFAGPLFGLGMDGSIYHPNLLRYDLTTDFTVGWAEETTRTSPGKSFDRSEVDYFGNFTGNATVLANKPYRANLYATSSHSFRDYDFFNRVQVDSLRYGAHAGYSQGPVPFTISWARYEEDTDTSGSQFRTSLRQTTLTLDARNDRASGDTTFNYGLNQFDRTSGFSDVSGTQHSFGIADREVFGRTRNMEWRNSAGYSTRDQSEGPSDVILNDSLTAGSQLQIEHPHQLSSAYDANYLRNDADAVVTENYGGGAGVKHQLFSSLTSGLRVQATKYTSSRSSTEFESTQYIGTWSESYTKKLTAQSRLSVSGSLGYSHTDQESSAPLQVVGEAHNFNSSGPVVDSFFLNLLNVNEPSIQVWDTGRTIRYTRNIDYAVMNVGGRTLIRLIEPNPSGLTRATPVIVDYEAASQGSGSIDGQFSDAQVRLDLFDGMFGIYGRFYNSDNEGSADIVVEDVTSVAFGADFSRKWFRAGGEYEIHEATFVSYTAARLYQSLSFTMDDASSLSVTFSEGAAEYDNGRNEEQYYSVIGRYHQGLTRRFGFDLDAGVSQRFGTLVDQLEAAVRPSISYNIGQLSAKLAYDFEYRQSDISGEERLKHMVTLRVSRRF